MSLNKLDRYQVLTSLNSGEFKKTWLAVDLHSPSQKKIIIKSFQPPTDQISAEIIEKLFTKEAAILEKLGTQSSQIPKLYAYFAQQQQYYFVQEYIEGKNLAQLGIISPQQCLIILASLLETLQYIHSQNIIHQNIKPENIIIKPSNQLPVLMDFGGVKAAIEILNTATVDSVISEAKAFHATEQNRGQTVFSSDLYALSLTMIYSLTGKKPIALPTNSITGDLEWQNLVPNLDQRLVKILTKASHREIANRYPTSQDMYQDLRQVAIEPEKPINTTRIVTRKVNQVDHRVSPTKPIPRTKPKVTTPTPTKVITPNPRKTKSANNFWKIMIFMPPLLGFAIGFLIVNNQLLSYLFTPEDQYQEQTDFSFPLEWQPNCGDDGSSEIGEWWAVKGPKSALELIKDEYCGDAFLFSKIGEIQVASFRSQEKAQSFANHLNQATGYDFWVKKSQ